MRYVLDTNIILHIVRNSDLWKRLKTEFRLTDSENKVYISIVSYAEIKSLAKQLDWGKTK
jgi:tRNA(fMet)-specific endonuclease VapC